MKTLTLLRHAKSDPGDSALADFDRPINQRGMEAAHAIGRELRDSGASFDDVFASPAQRVVDTLARLEEGFGTSLSPRFDQRLYSAPADLLLRIVQASDDRIERLLLVGHNPGLEQLAMAMANAGKRNNRRILMEKLPTAAFVVIALPIGRWRDAAPGTGMIERFVQPSDLAA